MTKMAGLPLPASLPSGPIFVDTGSCQCALRASQETVPSDKSHSQVWRCIGNATDNVYAGPSGKWFFPVNQGTKEDLNQTFNWANNPPDTGLPYIIEGSEVRKTLFYTPLNDTDSSELSEFDKVCTGQNDTLLSSPFYQALADTESGKIPVAAQLCVQQGALPITIQNGSSWTSKGCNLGFLCRSPYPRDAPSRMCCRRNKP